MTEQFPRAKTAIVGASTFGLGEMPGWSSIELAAKASQIALDDAGVPLGEVDALFICTPDDFLAGLTFAQVLGLNPRFTDNNRTGGSAFTSHVITAAAMLDAGMIDVALIAHGSNQRTGAGGKLVSAARSSRRACSWPTAWTVRPTNSFLSCFRAPVTRRAQTWPGRKR